MKKHNPYTLIVKALFIAPSLLAFSCAPTPVEELVDTSCLLEADEDPHPLEENYQKLIEADLEFTTGVQAALTDADGRTWTGAAGFADLANGETYSLCTRGAVASITKLVTATLVLKAKEEGLLELDDAVTDYLDESLLANVANAKQANLRQLLNHTSGIPDYLTLRHTFDGANEPGFKPTQIEKLDYLKGVSAEFNVGDRYSYSNTNYLLLGLLLEGLYNASLVDIFKSEIAIPLGLTGFAMGAESDPIPDDVARPYLALTKGKYQDITGWAVSDAATADGGALSNMWELQVFVQALFGGRIINQNSLNEMTTSVMTLTSAQSDFEFWPDEGYGLGVSRFNTPNGLAYGHTGSTATYNSALFYFPNKGASVAIIRNGIDVSIADESEVQNRVTMEAIFNLLQ